MNPASRNGRGILFMLAGLASIVTNDALTKFASQSMPLSQLMFVRGLFATVFLLSLGLAMRVPFRGNTLASAPVMARAGLDVLITITYLVGLTKLPLANCSALYLTTPLMMTVAGAVVLKEDVRATRWVATVIGFAGVLLILQPAGEDFNAWSFAIVFSALLTIGRDILLRSVSRDVPSLNLTFVTTVTVVLFSGFWATVQDWRSMDAPQVALLAAAGVFVSLGFFFTTVAIRDAELTIVGPLRYLALIFSAMLGYAVWGDIPNLLALVGMVLTVAAGIALVRR